MTKLEVYAYHLSQPSRAVMIFCKVNGIQFDEVFINLAKPQEIAPEFNEINPMRQVPAITHGSFKLFESHAIMIYLASAFPNVADHWYPKDLSKRAKTQSVLDWHHNNLRRGASGYIMNSCLAPFIGRPLNLTAAAEAEKILTRSLSILETFWLKDNAKFLLGSNEPSIADVSLVCELSQMQLLDEKDRFRLLSPYKKVEEWIENTRKATLPHFDEIHKPFFEDKEEIEKQRKMATASEV